MSLTPELAKDVATISRLSVVPTILKAAAHLTGMRFTAVARVTETSWTACAVFDQISFGLQPGGQLVLESTICNEIRQSHKPVVFGHASANPMFCDHPTPKLYGFESYISIPILRANGDFFGTLCALDPRQAKLDDPNILATLELFAQLIASQLDLEDRLTESQSALGAEQESARIREQFIAVLGHDLRQPLQAIKMGTEMLRATVQEAPAQRTLRNVQRSVGRMLEMIQNVLDFARGRLGGGIPVSMIADENLSEALTHVIAEVQSTHPDHQIHSSIHLSGPIVCDRSRVAQLLANLLVNAVVHGDSTEPVLVSARNHDGQMELVVQNGGAVIPGEKQARLFLPFTRGAPGEVGPGLGLGLFIASEIAKAQGGSLSVESTKEETRFVFKMPVKRAVT
jgi:signal transduction histidine kinase